MCVCVRVCACVHACTAANEPCDFTFRNRRSSLLNLLQAVGLFCSPVQRQKKSAGPASLPELVLHIMAHNVNIRLSLSVSLSLPLVLALALCVAYNAVIAHTFVVYNHTSRMALAEGQREAFTRNPTPVQTRV